MKILVVEDDTKILLSLSVRLRSAGHEVVTAQDGVSGTSAAVKEKPDLVLLDVSMPAGDGFKVAERMQQNTATVGTPVIFMTASRKPGIRQRAEDLGAAAFVVKPFEANELLEVVRRVEQNVLGPAPAQS